MHFISNTSTNCFPQYLQDVLKCPVSTIPFFPCLNIYFYFPKPDKSCFFQPLLRPGLRKVAVGSSGSQESPAITMKSRTSRVRRPLPSSSCSVRLLKDRFVLNTTLMPLLSTRILCFIIYLVFIWRAADTSERFGAKPLCADQSLGVPWVSLLLC